MRLRKNAAGRIAVFFTLAFLFLQPGTARSETPGVEWQEMKLTVQMAAAEKKTVPEQVQTAVTLEEAIRIAKEAFQVPEGFDQFSTGFNQSEKQLSWELRWYHGGEPGGDMNVRVDANTGEILGMQRWIPQEPGKEFRGLPRYTRAQAEGIAAALAKRLQPERFKETRLRPGSDYLPPVLSQARGQVEYSFNYARDVNGVPFPENGINIRVSGDTGEVMGYSLTWDGTESFPPAAGCITQEVAGRIFLAESAPELYYFRPQAPGGRMFL